MLSRNCPTCQKIIKYTSQRGYDTGTKLNSNCRKCSHLKINKMFTRNCPNCNKEIHYTQTGSHNREIKKNSNCRTCAQKLRNRSGLKNGMFGKEHSQETKNLISKKYAEKIENLKHSGTGRGWNGWYKNFFFRSSLELSYIYFLETNKIRWESMEKRDKAIPYIHPNSGSKRNYFADFFLPELKRVIEIKPIKLWNNTLVKIKAKAARKYCKKLGLSYELIDPKPLDIKEIQILMNSGDLIFHNKFQKYIERKFKK